MSDISGPESPPLLKGTNEEASDKKTRRGRPKGARNAKTIFNEVAKEMHTLQVDGKSRKINTVALLLHALTAKAMTGDLPAQKLLEKLRDRYAPRVKSSGGLLVVPEGSSIDQLVREAEIVNKYKEPPKGLAEWGVDLPNFDKKK